MSRKYEHRIEYLKENKEDKNHEHHQTKKKAIVEIEHLRNLRRHIATSRKN